MKLRKGSTRVDLAVGRVDRGHPFPVKFCIIFKEFSVKQINSIYIAGKCHGRPLSKFSGTTPVVHYLCTLNQIKLSP